VPVTEIGLMLTFTSVRNLEKRLASNEAWVHRPKPTVKESKPIDISNPNDFIARQRLMSDMIRLALATDSSRYVVCHFGSGSGVVPIDGVEEGYHTLSHHGLDQEKLSQLAIVEKAIVDSWGDFLRSLRETDEQGESILDTTSVILTSNLGNASSHSNRNMPVLFAGGGFRHGQHIAFDQNKNHPLPNLYLSILAAEWSLCRSVCYVNWNNARLGANEHIEFFKFWTFSTGSKRVLTQYYIDNHHSGIKCQKKKFSEGTQCFHVD